MHHRVAACGIALALVTVASPALADPVARSAPMSAPDEHALVVRQNAMRRTAAVLRWVQAVNFNRAVAYATALERAQHDVEVARRETVHRDQTRTTSTAQRYGSGACGGDLPPCYVMQRESHGDLRIWNGGCYNPVGFTGQNPCGSNASGKWQFMRDTWNGYGGYVNAADAPETVQDAKARETWAGGAGCSHWSEC